MLLAYASSSFVDWLPALLTIAAGYGLGKFIKHRVFAKLGSSTARKNMAAQLTPFVLAAVTLVIVIIELPIGDSTKSQLLSLIGLVLTGMIALSAATFIGNAMAGMMLRAVRNFQPGDFLKVGEHFGRVSEQGLLHTEIQTEERDLTTLPNMYLVTHPVTVVRASGTVVSAEVSLGYDIQRSQAEKALLAAANSIELKDAFVQVRELGDFSVTYRVAGFLEEVKILLSARSNLRAAMLDHLHAHGIEIVSPNFMNQRQLDPHQRVMPKGARSSPKPTQPIEELPESKIFDKADEAESIASIQEHVKSVQVHISEIKQSMAEKPKDADDLQGLQDELEKSERKLTRLIERLEARQKEKDQEN